VVSLTVYRWGPPPDPAAVARSVVAAAAGEVDAVLFTSAPGAAEWITAARQEGLLEAIVERESEHRVLMAAVGPITAGPLREAGLDPLIAERGRLGSLVRAVVTHFGGGGAASLPTSAGRLELRSTGIVLEGRHIPLSRSATDIVAALFDAQGGVVSRPRLQAALPRSGENTHAVEMAVARLREALGVPDLVKTVVKRGYRLNVVDPA
jgi:uroporphyrinogen-III synthase